VKRRDAVGLVFKLTQHSKDEQLFKSLIPYFGQGNVYKKSPESQIIEFKISKFEALSNIVIPFFNQYPIIGVKAQDYEDFKKVAVLIKKGVHLSPKGLEEICLIKAGMNRGRK
jgi:hypothetical protein